MSTNSDFDRVASAWLADGPVELSDRVLGAALSEVHLTRQRRATRAPWRYPTMPSLTKLAGAAVTVVALVAGTAWLLGLQGQGPGVGGEPTRTPGPDASTASPSPRASATPDLGESPTPDTAGWTTYTSSRYGFQIGHPADWALQPAVRAWTMETDAANFRSTAQEAFVNPAASIRVSAWTTDTGLGKVIDDPAEILAWVEDYCAASRNTPCTGIADRAVPMCVEKRDCHPALLVPFADDVQAFVPGLDDGEITVVAVWRRDSDPSVALYGGGRKLLEAFLSTMDVWPAP
jgi:hypothetical protein